MKTLIIIAIVLNVISAVMYMVTGTHSTVTGSVMDKVLIALLFGNMLQSHIQEERRR